MFDSRLALMLLSLASLAGCAATAAEPQDEGPSATDDDALSAVRPIPYVLQYVGRYDATDSGAAVRWIILRRAGTFAANIRGVVKTGKFFGPNAPADPLKIVFVTRNERPWTGTISGWQKNATMQLTRDGATESVVAPWLNGNEAMCDDTGGRWTDDDADPATGLFCVCPATQSWIPASGGCVD